MKRTTRPKRPDLILAADLHLRDTVPVCRTDDYWAAQERKLNFILNLQEQHDVPLIVAGDFFDKAKSSPFLEAWLIEELDTIIRVSDRPPKDIAVVPGQHDLPNHSLELLHTSSLSVLWNAGAIWVGLQEKKFSLGLHDVDIRTFPYGRTPTPVLEDVYPFKRRICVAHYLIEADFPTESPVEKAKMFLLRMKGFDLILTGDNHKQFVVEHQGRWLVNPGSMMRMAADQEDHTPAVYLWYAETNHVEPVYLPIEQGVISRKHIEKKEQRDERIEVFVSRLDAGYELSLSYKRNFSSYFDKNRTRKAIRNKVWEAVDSG